MIDGVPNMNVQDSAKVADGTCTSDKSVWFWNSQVCAGTLNS